MEKKKEMIEEMKRIMTEKKDYKKMPLPRSFAYTMNLILNNGKTKENPSNAMTVKH